jgi:CHASE3 domain sensor protein
MGSWYYAIVPETIELRKQEQLEMLQAFVEDAEQLQTMKDTNPTMAAMSPDEIFTQQAANIEVFFSPVFFMGTVLMVWIFSGALLSAVFSWLMPRIWNQAP